MPLSAVQEILTSAEGNRYRGLLRRRIQLHHRRPPAVVWRHQAGPGYCDHQSCHNNGEDGTNIASTTLDLPFLAVEPMMENDDGQAAEENAQDGQAGERGEGNGEVITKDGESEFSPRGSARSR